MQVMRLLSLAVAALLWGGPALAQNSSPGFTGGGSVFGRLSAQWNAYFASKVDAVGGVIDSPRLLGTLFLKNLSTDADNVFIRREGTSMRLSATAVLGSVFNASSDYQLSNVAALQRDPASTSHVFMNYEGNLALAAQSASGVTQNVHRAATHVFQDASGASTFASLTSAGAFLQSAALATSATGPFFYASAMAGKPTGTPVSASAGRSALAVDTVNHKICWYEQATATWNCSFDTNTTWGPVFRPERYGAIGDGIADDTAAWKATCAALQAAGRGTILGEPSAEYLVYSTYTASSGLESLCELGGVGAVANVLVDLNGADFAVGANLSGSAQIGLLTFGTSSVKNFVVRGMRFRQTTHPVPIPTSPPYGTTGVLLFGGRQFRIENPYAEGGFSAVSISGDGVTPLPTGVVVDNYRSVDSIYGVTTANGGFNSRFLGSCENVQRCLFTYGASQQSWDVTERNERSNSILFEDSPYGSTTNIQVNYKKLPRTDGLQTVSNVTFAPFFGGVISNVRLNVDMDLSGEVNGAGPAIQTLKTTTAVTGSTLRNVEISGIIHSMTAFAGNVVDWNSAADAPWSGEIQRANSLANLLIAGSSLRTVYVDLAPYSDESPPFQIRDSDVKTPTFANDSIYKRIIVNSSYDGFKQSDSVGTAGLYAAGHVQIAGGLSVGGVINLDLGTFWISKGTAGGFTAFGGTTGLQWADGSATGDVLTIGAGYTKTSIGRTHITGGLGVGVENVNGGTAWISNGTDGGFTLDGGTLGVEVMSGAANASALTLGAGYGKSVLGQTEVQGGLGVGATNTNSGTVWLSNASTGGFTISGGSFGLQAIQGSNDGLTLTISAGYSNLSLAPFGGGLLFVGLATTPGSKQPVCIDTTTKVVYEGSAGAC